MKFSYYEKKVVFEFDVSDECGWRIIEIFTKGDELWAEAFNRDGDECNVDLNWWERIPAKILKDKLIIKESYGSYRYVKGTAAS